jgi:hypothetical protein
VAGETIIVPIRSGVADLECVFTLDEVGSVVWRELESPVTAEQVVGRVIAEFEIGEAEARRDVIEFLSSLNEAGLILHDGEVP